MYVTCAIGGSLSTASALLFVVDFEGAGTRRHLSDLFKWLSLCKKFVILLVHQGAATMDRSLALMNPLGIR